MNEPRLWSPLSEAMLLGALLLNDARMWDEGVAEVVKPTDFHSPPYGMAFRACLWLRSRGVGCTAATVAYAFERLGMIDEVDDLTGGAEPWLVGLTEHVYTTIGSSAHAKVIAHYARLREQVAEGQRLVKGAYATVHPHWADQYRDEVP